MYNYIINHQYTPLCTHHSKSSFPSSPCIWPPLRSPSCPTLFPSGNHPLLCPWVYLGFFVVVGSSVAFCFISHILVKSCVSCSFPSNLFHLAWYSQDPSILSQIIVFHPFFWLRSIPLYARTTRCLAIHPLMDVGTVSTFGNSEYAAMDMSAQVSVWVPAFNNSFL